MRVINNENDFGYFFLVFYIFWGWIFTKTVYANNLFVYLSFVYLFIAFTLKLVNKLNHDKVEIDKLAWAWIPYYAYTCLGWLSKSNFENFVYYFVCLIIVIIAYGNNIQNKIPYKFIIYSGLLTVASIFFQMLTPSVYTSIIGNKLEYAQINLWTSGEYGFNGIMYQLGCTAEMLTVALLVFWSVGRNLIKWISENKVLYWAIFVVFVICTFLTGKRINSLMVIVIPSLIIYFQVKSLKKRLAVAIGLGILFFAFVSLIIINAEDLVDNFIFRRVAISVLSTESDGWSGVSGGREFLFDKALDMFYQNPIFGAGLGSFVSRYGIMVHNMYYQTLAEQGVVGLVLLLYPLLFCLTNTVYHLRNIRVASYKPWLMLALALQLNYIIQGFTDNTSIGGFLLNAVAIALTINYKYIRVVTKNNISQ